MNTRLRTPCTLLVCLVGLTLSATVHAASSILVLDFGLKDDTLLPRVEAEVSRVASIAPYVRESLRVFGDDVPEAAQPPVLAEYAANGYLLAHPREAVDIGRRAGARWVAVGYSNKFSFLVSWVRVHLIDTTTGKVVARAEADLRGAMDDARMTRRTAYNLAEQVHELVAEIERSRTASAAP